MLYIFGALIIFFLALYIGLRALELQLLFHPRTAAQEWLPLAHDFEEICFIDQTNAIWCPLQTSETVVLYCHGNYGNLSMREEWIRALQRHLQASVLLFDPPGYGKTPGKPSEVGCYASAESAFSWLISNGWKSSQIVLWGKSLGGGMATQLAISHPEIRALILLDAFSNVPEAANVLLPIPLGFLARNRFDNAAKIGQITAPKILVGGENDALCPAWMTRKLGDIAIEPKTVKILRGRNHADFWAQPTGARLPLNYKVSIKPLREISQKNAAARPISRRRFSFPIPNPR